MAHCGPSQRIKIRPAALWSCLSAAVVALLLLLAGSGGWFRSPEPTRPPESLDSLFVRAEKAIENDKLTLANSLLDEILNRDPKHGMALLYRGQLARDRGEPDAALADWQRVGSQPADTAGTARYLEATVWLERGDTRRAEQLLKQSVHLHPAYRDPHSRLLELYVAQGRRDAVRREIQRAAGRLGWTLNDLIFRFVPPLMANTPSSGAALMRYYLKANPTDRPSRLALAQYLLIAKKPREALDALARIPASPANEHAAAASSQAWLMLGDSDQAAALLEGIPVTKTSTTDLLRAKAELAIARQDWPRAVKYLERVVEAEPEDAASLYRLGRVWQRLGREEDAYDALARAEKLDLLQTTALRMVWGSKNNVAVAREPLLQEISRLLFDLGYPVESARWLRRLVALTPRDPVASGALRDMVTAIRSQPELASRPDPFGPNESNMVLVARRGAPSGLDSDEGNSAPSDDKSASQSDAKDQPAGPAQIVLRDRHAEAGIDYVYFNGHTGFKYLVESMGGGVGVLDYDADGTPDLYLPQGSGIPPDPSDHSHLDQLYRNLADGTFQNVTKSAGIIEARYGQGIACADYDNDGFGDVVVANYGRNTCYRNNGDGTFSRVDGENGLGDVFEMTSSLGFGDLDRDGILDLYVTNYVTELKVCQGADGTYHSCRPANFDAEQDRLFRGAGDGTFEEVTQSAGVIAPLGKGLGVLIADFNDDDQPDVYVANDTTPNFLFLNHSQPGSISLKETGLAAGVALDGNGRAQAGMGIACADFDGNGWLDLHVTNFYQETNTLYLNQGGGFFIDATGRSGLAGPSFNLLGFGTQAADFNLDGWPDLFVANGHIDDFRDRGEPWQMPPQVFANKGDARFTEQSAQAGPYFEGKYLGRGVARLDYDDDGRPDLAVVNQDRPLALLHNESPDAGHRLVLQLRGTKSNRSAIGTEVRVSAGGRTQFLAITGGDGFFSTNQRRMFVGIGEAKTVNRLEIEWPSGLVETWTDLPANISLICREGLPLLRLPLNETPGN